MSVKSFGSSKDCSSGRRSAAEDEASESGSSTSEDPASFVLREVPHTETETLCKLCFRPAQPPGSSLRLGTLYEFGYCTAHLFCLMFSANLNQLGDDNEGINGFRAEDIVKEWRRGSQLKCIYCKKKYATLGCGKAGCKKGYHLPCGLENGTLQQFQGNFESFCSVHKPLQTPFLQQKKSGAKLNMREECGCCTMPLQEEGTTPDFLWTPCCSGWFHRDCIEKTAETAGTHFFKCPLCNNKKDFTEEMLKFGVFVPDRDADWETGNAFAEQLHRHDSCDTENCLCPAGRNFDEEDTAWEIMLCVLCGAQGIHVECGELDRARPRWKCSMCKPVVASMSNKPISVFTRVKRSQEPPNKEFTRAVFENLTFRVDTESYEINVDLHKNRKNPKDPVLVSFKVEGVPAFDIPQPVKLQKSELSHEIIKMKNIPCPYDDCEELLSRLEFKEHCLKHKEVKVEEKCKNDIPHESFNVIESQKYKISNADESEMESNEIPNEVENRHETKLNSELEDRIEQPKQSSISNFFTRFSPKSPEFCQPLRKKIRLEKVKPPFPCTPTKTEDKCQDTVISSPFGYFKVDGDVQVKSPPRNVLSEQSNRQVDV